MQKHHAGLVHHHLSWRMDLVEPLISEWLWQVGEHTDSDNFLWPLESPRNAMPWQQSLFCWLCSNTSVDCFQDRKILLLSYLVLQREIALWSSLFASISSTRGLCSSCRLIPGVCSGLCQHFQFSTCHGLFRSSAGLQTCYSLPLMHCSHLVVLNCMSVCDQLRFWSSEIKNTSSQLLLRRQYSQVDRLCHSIVPAIPPSYL